MNTFDVIAYQNRDFSVPKKCPHCGSIAFTTPSNLTYIDSYEGRYYMVIFNKNCCNKSFICLYKEIFNKVYGEKNYSFIETIPKYVPIDNIPSCINEICPRFINLYKQAVDTLEKGYNELATSGFRNSLELLVKEYAINFLKEPYENVSKMSLYNSIETYFKFINSDKSGHYIRIIGNDCTHFQKKYEDADPYALKRYISLIANRISQDYELENPPELIPLHHQK